jgi:hypothetical protein
MAAEPAGFPSERTFKPSRPFSVAQTTLLDEA